jgi:PAS domain S-box-containing protein
MIIGIAISISTLLQYAAAFLALRLISITGKRVSWGLISLAIFLMAVRRSISLFQLIPDRQIPSLELTFELIGLLVSILMLAGLLLISPLFKSMATSILELRKAEETARENEKKLYDITSNLAEGIFVLNGRGAFSFMNQEAERLTGWTFEELKDKVVHDIIHYEKGDDIPLPVEECEMLSVIKTGKLYSSTDVTLMKKDGSHFPVSVISSPIAENGKVLTAVTAFRDITEQKQLEKDREKLIEELKESLKTIKKLQGILPICASCKKIRDNNGEWSELEFYIMTRADVDFSHGICPECAKRLYPDLNLFKNKG